MSKKGKIQYYQIREKGNQINFIWFNGKQSVVAEVRRLPYEEGFLDFLKAQTKSSKDGKVSGAKTLSSELDIHEFANHLNLAYRRKKN